jgi:hypothetical protein
MSLYDSSVRPESMSTRIWTPPPYADESKYLAIVNPYPPKANLDSYPDQRTLALWLASCASKEVLRSLFYRLSVSSFFLISPTPNPRIPQSFQKWSSSR